MTSASAIEWTEFTWNPVTGCTKVSPGCKNCYALSMANRLHAMGAPGYHNGFALSLMDERIEQPLKRRKPTMYFVNSMSDLFHEGVTDEFIGSVLDVISQCPQHTFQILTKRAERLPSYFKNQELPKNIWLGVSVENRYHGVPRISFLRKVNASIRFLSIEPLLEDLGKIDLSDIGWVVVGGENSSQARPMEREWVTNIRDQVIRAKIPFFFKQWGTYGPDGVKRSKKRNGRLLDGKIYNEFPEESAF